MTPVIAQTQLCSHFLLWYRSFSLFVKMQRVGEHDVFGDMERIITNSLSNNLIIGPVRVSWSELQTSNLETFKLNELKIYITTCLYSGISHMLHVSTLIIPFWNAFRCFSVCFFFKCMAEYICRRDYSRLEFDLWVSAEVNAVEDSMQLPLKRLTWEHDSAGLISAAVHHQQPSVLRRVIASPVLSALPLIRASGRCLE